MVRRLSLCREVAGLVSRCGHAGAEASVEIGSVLRDPEADLGPFDWRVGAVIVHAGEHRGRPRRSVSVVVQAEDASGRQKGLRAA